MELLIKIVKRIFWGICLVLSILVIWINIQLHSDNFNKSETEKDILKQLNYLKYELNENKLGNKMQAIFPEGYLFSNALYGLAWCELGISDTSKTVKTIALQEALNAYQPISFDEAKSVFNPSMTPQYGVFYLGWNNYLLSKILLLNPNFKNNDKYKKIFIEQCYVITDELKKNNSPFLESYPTQSWPADMCVAMASIRNHDKLFYPKYDTIISDWVAKVKTKLDPKTKLIPHKVNPDSGEAIEGTRGSSISLILRFLSEIDTSFANEQYQLYKENFISTTFGLPSINEYPNGNSGNGDIDSGPVLFGVGFAGTIVSIGTLSVFGDCEQADKQYKTVNAFGFCTKTQNSKKYLLGQLPITDAFIAWSRSSGLKCRPVEKFNYSILWPIKFHLISLVTLIIIWSFYFWKNIYKKIKWSQ